MDKAITPISNDLTTQARIVALIYQQQDQVTALQVNENFLAQVTEIEQLNEVDLSLRIESDATTIQCNYDTVRVVVEFLNNASNCKACQQGNGCGALFFNELAKPTRNLFTITQTTFYNQSPANYEIGEIISIGVQKTVYWMSIGLLYVLPMLLCMIIPLSVVKTLGIQIHDLVLVALIIVLLAGYYLVVKNRFSTSSFTLYIHAENAREPNCSKITQL